MPGRADFIDAAVVGFGLVLMICAGKLLPEGALQTILTILGFLIVIGDTVLIEFIFEWMTMHYAYLRMELQPSGRILHTFLEYKPQTEPITKTLNATRLVFHWVVKHQYYGKFKECVIHHELDFWGKRVVPGPGYAVFQGYAIRHPQVARIVVHEYPYTSDRWKDLSRPAFMLAYAHGGDEGLVPIAMTTTMTAITEVLQKNPQLLQAKGNPTLSLGKILAAMRHYEAMSFAYIEKNREAQYYRTRLLRLEGGEESRDSLSKGLLEIPRDTSKRGLELVHGWYTECGSFDRIVKKYGRPPRWRLTKNVVLLAMTAITALTIGFLAMIPGVRVGLGSWFSTLQNQIVLVIVIVSGMIVLYLMKRRKG